MKKLLVILGTILCGGMYAQSVDLLPEGTFTAAMEASSHDAAGNLYAVGLDVPHKGNVAVVRDGKVSLYLTLPEGSVGNGIVWDKDGNMYIADYTAHNVWIKRRGKENLELYAHRSDMSQPNDLAIHPAGYIYASDPAWNKSTGRLWLVKEGEITLLEDNMGTTSWTLPVCKRVCATPYMEIYDTQGRHIGSQKNVLCFSRLWYGRDAL